MDYICPNWPFYDLGKGIKFEDGRFSTEDPGQKEIIESNDKYMVFIWPVPPPAEKNEAVDDKASEGGLPAPQQDNRETAGSSPVKQASGGKHGRKERPVFQELEDIVRGSGIAGGKGKKGKVTVK